MEEAFKMRNLLQEFLKKHDGVRYPTILGLREHIFTGRFIYWFHLTTCEVLYFSFLYLMLFLLFLQCLFSCMVYV